MRVHSIINLRAQLHEALIADAVRCYGGKNSATMKGKYFYTNLGLSVLFILKPIVKK